MQEVRSIHVADTGIFLSENKKSPVHTLGRKPCFRGTTRIPDNCRALLTHNGAKPPQPTRNPSALVLKRELQMNVSQAACSR